MRLGQNLLVLVKKAYRAIVKEITFKIVIKLSQLHLLCSECYEIYRKSFSLELKTLSIFSGMTVLTVNEKTWSKIKILVLFPTEDFCFSSNI